MPCLCNNFIRDTERVADVLKRIISDSFTGAAVVNDEGKIQANFSISDLRVRNNSIFTPK